nr:gustatory receptor 2a isoform X2 [Fopius arisanus]
MRDHPKAIILEILILLFKLCGFIPFAYSTKSKLYPKNCGLLKWASRFNLLYNFILIAGIFTIYIRTAVNDFSFSIEQLRVTPLKTFELGLAGCIPLTIWIVFIINRHEVMKMLDKSFELEQLMTKRYSLYWSKRGEVKATGALVIYVIFGIIIALTWQYKVTKSPPDWVFMYFISKFVIALCLLKYSILCLMMENVVECLNRALSNLHEITPRQCNSINENFKNIRSMYCLVWDIAEMVNGIFGISVLIIITFVCYGIIYTVLRMITLIRNSHMESGPITIQPFYVMQLGLVIASCILIWSTTNAVREFRKTSGLLHRMSHRSGRDIILRLEVLAFSLESNQQFTGFSANGFFCLNYALLQGITAAIISYVMIFWNVNV